MTEQTPIKLLLTPRQAAAALAISDRTLWAMTAPRGPIPALRIGNRAVRYDVQALRDYIAAQQRIGGCAMSDTITLDDLEAAGLSARDVRVRRPHATEYVALDGRLCWLREQLTVRLGEEPEEGDEV